MDMRNGMVVWAPDGNQMKEIRRRVSKERAKAAADFFKMLGDLFRKEGRKSADRNRRPAGCPAGA